MVRTVLHLFCVSFFLPVYASKISELQCIKRQKLSKTFKGKLLIKSSSSKNRMG